MRPFLFLDSFCSRARTLASRFEPEAEIRTQDQDLRKLRPNYLRVLIAVSALGTLIGAFQLATPPTHPITRLNRLRHIYVSEAQMCFLGGHQSSCKLVKFPPGENDRIAATAPVPIEYRFQVSLDENNGGDGLSSLLVPLVWGKTDVYRNDVLIVRGSNILEVVPLVRGSNHIRIVVFEPSGIKLGIRALYPPTILSADDAQRINTDIIQEPMIFRLTVALQLMVVAILAMFWIWSKSQPELLFFLLLALVEILKNVFHLYIGSGLFLFSIQSDDRVYEALRSLSIFLAVPFSLTVCRVPLRYMSDMPRKYGLQYLGIVVFVTIAATSIFTGIPLSGARTVGFVAASAFFMLWTSVPRLAHMLVVRLHSRFVLTSLTLFGVMVWYFRLVSDLFQLHTAITTEYNNQLLFFVVMAGILAFQFGRTESRFSLVKSLITREAVRKVEGAGTSFERRGFVVLVDIVGWTRKRRRIRLNTARNEFNQKTLQVLFKAFDAPEFSLLQQLGDSVFFACTSEPTRERFEDIVARCKDLSLRRPTMKELGLPMPEIADEQFIARGTVYYGPYDIVFAESRYHKKEAFSGDAPETCARIIGNDPDPKVVRVVAGTDLDAFRPEHAPIHLAKGKGIPEEPEWRYWEA